MAAHCFGVFTCPWVSRFETERGGKEMKTMLTDFLYKQFANASAHTWPWGARGRYGCKSISAGLAGHGAFEATNDDA
jgi:hypothetical protein